VVRTYGPNGERPTPSVDLVLHGGEVRRLKAGSHTAALVWHTSSDWTSAVRAGARGVFRQLGIRVVAETDAGYDAMRQRSDIESVTARNPDVILSLPVDPAVTASAFRQARRAGAELVFISNVPNGFRYPRDYVGIVTDDLFAIGKRAADIMAHALGGRGKVGWIFHDADYYVTNQRDRAFKATIERDYPQIAIGARAGLANPANAERIATRMIARHPDLDGIYVTWAEPAEGVVRALQNAGNRRTKVVTIDLSERLALDMAKGGNVAGMAADLPYELGRALAVDAAYALLGRRAPAFTVVPALAVTRDNLAQGWRESLRRDPPRAVLRALEG
jgi:ribose transport system substrate-binding protein